MQLVQGGALTVAVVRDSSFLLPQVLLKSLVEAKALSTGAHKGQRQEPSEDPLVLKSVRRFLGAFHFFPVCGFAEVKAAHGGLARAVQLFSLWLRSLQRS